MSNSPTGTSIDQERLLELRPLEETAESTFAVTVTPLLERLEMPEDSHIDWDIDDRNGEPMLVFGRISEDEASVGSYPRRLRDDDGSIVAPVPDTLVFASPPDGLGFDRGSYDVDTSLLFESIATGETIGLLPVRFDDGTPYRADPSPETDARSDPIAQAQLEHDSSTGEPTPRPETVDAPIDPDVLEAVVDERDVSLDALSSVLEEMSRRRLVGEGDAVGEYPPIAVDDRGVCVVSDDEWSGRLRRELSIDDRSVLDGARVAHNRQAKRLFSELETTEYRSFESEYDAIVTDERETAEWETTDPGSG